MTDVLVRREPLTYEPDSPNSFLLDIARSKALHDDGATARLERHSLEMAVENRTNPNTTLTTGGEFAPPGYLVNLYATAAKIDRRFADLIGSRPIPRGISQINIPRLIDTDVLGQDTGIQAANAEAVASNDPTSAFNTSPVVTISGNLLVSQQLYDLAAAPGFDVIGVSELSKDYDAQLDYQLVNGTGSNGQVTGLANFSYLTANSVSGASVPASLTGASNMIAALWPLLGQAAANVGNNRGRRPDFWLMAPRRWFAIAGSLDQQSRPIMSPAAQAPVPLVPNAEVGSTPVPVSNIHGIPVYTDGAIPVTTYSGGAASGTVGALADTVYCGRVADVYLFESAPMIQASVNATAGNLQVRLQLHRYAAFVGNLYTSAFGRVTSIPQPTNY